MFDVEYSPDPLFGPIFMIEAAKTCQNVLIRHKHHLMKLLRAHDLGQGELPGTGCWLDDEVVCAFLFVHVEAYVALRLSVDFAEQVLPFRFVLARRVAPIPLTARLDAVIDAVVDEALFAHRQTVPANEFDLR